MTDQLKNQLIGKIINKQAIIGVCGLGYVGLPLALRFAQSGFQTIGFDIDSQKISALNEKKSYIGYLNTQLLAETVGCKFIPTLDFKHVHECDCLIICVPTPLTKHSEPDLSYITNTTKGILPFLKSGQLISLESTTYPGTTEEIVLPILEQAGFICGQDLFLIYSPEREDPGNSGYASSMIPKVCGGLTNNCLDIGVTLYQQVSQQVVPVSNLKVAEMTKLLENIHRAVNISLVNELKMVTDKMNIDLYEVIAAASTKPFGFTPYYPGPGLGGHCIPIDPFYLTWKAKEFGIRTRFVELAGEINTQMPDWVIGKICDGLNGMAKSFKNSHILLLGLAYKKNINDTRESPSIEIIRKLLIKGAMVDYADPLVPSFPKNGTFFADLKSINLNSENVASYDCVVLVTDHDIFDYAMIFENARLIIDTRNAFPQKSNHVIRA